jgi:hypothetical protein
LAPEICAFDFQLQFKESKMSVGEIQTMASRMANKVARFFLTQYTKKGKIYQMTTNYTKRPYIIPNGRKILLMVIKYTNIFHSKALQN